MSPIGVNLTCNSNCNKWCPRVLKIFCCCCKVTNDDDDNEVSETDEKIKKVQNVEFSKDKL